MKLKRRKRPATPTRAKPTTSIWLATLERILTENGVVERGVLARTRDAWQRACSRTPHGTPIELRAEDFRD